MSILDRLTGHSERRVGERVVVVLTPLGKTKADKIDLPSGKWQVLATLDEQGACTISELSNECQMSQDRVKQIVKDFIATGYVKKAGGTGEQ